ncbi:MAG: hypothetical protein LQ340_005683 [Diploschistes diacapsis]|nr:MAG: hypothetical protein LQ340_005683 [Diploschistes diacapsis]
MYAFATRSRFFRKRWYKRADLKHNDRARMGKRDAFRKFVDGYVPSLPDDADGGKDEGRDARAREEVLHEVLDLWRKKEKWAVRRREWEEERTALRQRQIARGMRKEEGRWETDYADAWIRKLGGRG